MGLTFQALFKGPEMKTLSASNPVGVVIDVQTDPATSKLIITAQGVDAQSRAVGTPITGCPTPCHPIVGNLNCLNDSINLWEQTTGQQFV